MKRKMFAIVLCLGLLLPALPVSAASAWGEAVDGWSSVLAPGALLTQSVSWTGGDYRTENYLTLSPGAALTPAVVSMETLTAAGGMDAAARALEQQGLHTVAGINGGYFTLATGVPVGIVAGDGALRSWSAEDAWMDAVGFRADGGAVIGKPGVSLTLRAGEDTVAVAGLNQPRGAGLALYTDDFAATTKTSGGGWNVVCALDGAIPLSGSVTLTVERVVTVDGAVAIPEGRAVLSFAGDTEKDEAPAWLDALSAGDTLTLETACAGDWETVTSAVGLLYPLVEGGAVASGLAKYADAAPRTAIGLRSDGGVVLYTVDGRQSGHSVGAGLDAVARRLLELGCVSAGALDGGASTSLRAILPGDSSMTQVSSPSGGGRNVVNYILLSTDAKPTGRAARLALYPQDIDILLGAGTALTVKAVDANGYAAPLPGNITYTVSDGLGTVEQGVFHAKKAGSGTITAAAPGVEPVSIPVTVVETPDEILLYGERYGRLTTSLTLEPGQEVDLTARALNNHVLLESADECFTWALEPDGGEVDQTGHIVPAPVSGTGTLTASAGTAKAEIPITVWSGVPFRDILTSDPRFPAIKYTYDHDLFKGTETTIFDPDVVMNRAMLVTVLWRMNGYPEAEAQPGFLDVPRSEWYGPAVAWASKTGIVAGYSDEEFGPLDELTKEQILAILWRYADYPETAAELTAPDGAAVSEYARAPLAWALEALIDPDAEGKLLPQAPMTRAMVADVLMRYLEH